MGLLSAMPHALAAASANAARQCSFRFIANSPLLKPESESRVEMRHARAHSSADGPGSGDGRGLERTVVLTGLDAWRWRLDGVGHQARGQRRRHDRQRYRRARTAAGQCHTAVAARGAMIGRGGLVTAVFIRRCSHALRLAAASVSYTHLTL